MLYKLNQLATKYIDISWCCCFVISVVFVATSDVDNVKYCAIPCMQLKILKQTYRTRGYCIHLRVI